MKFDAHNFFRCTLAALGFDPVIVPNTYDPPHDPDLGWPLKLPDVDFHDRTLLVLNLQDWLTWKDGGWQELRRIESTYQDRSNRVAVIVWPHDFARHYSGPVNVLEFNVHEVAILHNLADTADVWRPQLDQAKDLAWQCLNGRRCPHRLRAAQCLEKEPNGVLSYGDVIPLTDWPYSTYPGTENEDNFLRLLPVYSRAAVNIVTETRYEEPSGIISEKTMFAMLGQQIPIVLGYRGIVSDCRSLGFDVFDDVVDTSYDQLPNDQRVEAAIRSNLDLIRGRIDLRPYRERLQQQQAYLLERWVPAITDRFQNQCRSMASRLLSG